MKLRRVLGALALPAALTLVSAAAHAEVSEPSPRADDAFDIMNLLTHRGLHDIHDETWNLYGQFTYISSWKLPFAAQYTNLNGSTHTLGAGAERSFTGTFTVFFGLRLWEGAEAHLVPEVLSMRPLSGLTGLGGAIQNAELQKTGGEAPQIYQSRAYLQQTIGLGGARVVRTSDPMQLGTVADARRLVIRVGNFSIIDFFDKNAFAGDLRQQFFNMAFLTYSAYDFAADARGYAYGATADLFYDDWALRIGRITPPQDPNQEPLDFRLDQHYGDQAELEHRHRIAGKEGAVRVLAFRNRENMGRFDDAIAAHAKDPTKNAAACTAFNYGSNNAAAPDLCWVRRPNVKVGIGVNVEQHLTPDIGVFLRAMVSDGRTEVYSFMSSDRSLSFGATAKGAAWGRPKDVTGLGVGLGWISRAHADYLRLGGIDGFIGDGNIRADVEGVVEGFYGVNVWSSVWLSGDFQHIVNPAYNADRGPVEVVNARVHAEF